MLLMPHEPPSSRSTIVKPIPAAHTHPIRAVVLRPGRPATEAVFPGDEDADTVHFGAYTEGRLAGIASIYREAPPGESDDRAWRLRGMATLPEVRGRRLGVALVEACLQRVAIHGGTRLWCNARTEASGFYRKLGFEIIGGEFDIPTVGPHYLMSRSVP